MNHITQIMNTKSSERYKTLKYNNSPSPRNGTFTSPISCSSWSSKLLCKVKKCHDAIKTMMTPNKTTNTNNIAKTEGCNNDSNNNYNFNYSGGLKSIKSNSSIPDTLKCNRLSNNENETELIEIVQTTSNSELSVVYSQKKKISASLGQMDVANDSNDSLSYSLSTITNTTHSFRVLEKEIEEEYLKDQELKGSAENVNIVPLVKKKISVEPYFSLANEFDWPEDLQDSTTEEIFNSSDCSNSDIKFDDPRQSSTFCEDSDEKKCTSSPIRSFAPHDSGYENNFSMLHDII